MENVSWKFILKNQWHRWTFFFFFSGTSEPDRQLKLPSIHLARKEHRLQEEIISNLLT